jgi:hypothetical protein
MDKIPKETGRSSAKNVTVEEISEILRKYDDKISRVEIRELKDEKIS